MNRILLIITACGLIAAWACFAIARSFGPFDWLHGPQEVVRLTKSFEPPRLTGTM